MKELVEFELPDGSMIAVEVDEEDLGPGIERAARPGEIAGKAEKTFQEALDRIKPMVASVRDTVVSVAPDECTVEFGIKLSAKAGAVIASTDAEAHVTITMGWHGSE